MKFIKSSRIIPALMATMMLFSCNGDKQSSSYDDFDNPLPEVINGVVVGAGEIPEERPPLSDEDVKRQEEAKTGYEEAKAINSDTFAFLTVPNTNITYPVMSSNSYYASMGNKANDYYLNRDINKKWSKQGVIYSDFRVKFGSTITKNAVLYGHNWYNVIHDKAPRLDNPDDIMFGQLLAYHHLDFAQQNPYVYLQVGDTEYTYKVFAAFYTDIGFYYIETDPTAAEFDEIVKEAKSRSQHNFDVPVSGSDYILTLSTCTRYYSELGDNQRFVVMARLLRNGENNAQDVQVAKNPSPKLPKGANASKTRS